MRGCSVLLAGVIAGAVVMGRVGPAAGATGWSHVELEAAVDVGAGEVAGRAVWRYVNRGSGPVEAVHFVLAPNLEAAPNPHLSAAANAAAFWNAWAPAGLSVEGVTVAGAGWDRWRFEAAPARAQTWGLERGLLVVELPAPLGAGEAVEVGLGFRTRLPHRRGDGGVFNGDLTARFGWFPQPRPQEGDGWSDAVYPSAFTHRTRLTVPSGYTGVVGAERVAQAGQVVSAESGVPVRSVPLVVSDRVRSFRRSVGGVEVAVHLHPDGALWDPAEDEAERVFEQVGRILDDFGGRYGRYRLGSLQVVESPTTFTSMAADGMVLLGDLFFVFDDILVADGVNAPLGEVVLAHEMAHQWWGLALGVAYDSEAWLSDGLAQHLAYAYAGRRFGREGVDMYDSNAFVAWVIGAFSGRLPAENGLDHVILPAYERMRGDGIDEAVVAPLEVVAHREADDYRYYQKGLLVARALEGVLGEARCEAVLRAVYAARAGERVRVEDLVAAARAAGGEVEGFVEAFVRGRAWADVAVAGVEWDAHETRVRVRREGSLAVPAVVEVVHGDEVTRAPVGAEREGVVVVGRGGEPDAVRVDPEARVPDVDRRNNRWGDAIDWQWYGARTEAERHVIAVNPLPLQRAGLLGVSLAGASGRRWWWDAGAGLVGLRAGELEGRAVRDQVYQAAMGVGWAVDRAHTVRLSGEVSWLREEVATGRVNDVTASVGPTWSWSGYEATAVGQLGVTEVARTTVSVGPRLDVYDYAAETRYAFDDGTPLRDGIGGRVFVAVERDEWLKWGAVGAVRLTGGYRPIGARGDGVAVSPWFGVGEVAVDYERPVPWLGWWRVGVTAASLTPEGPSDQRPALWRLPRVGDPVAGPFDAVVSGEVVWRIPVLRDRRIKNLLTLDLLVFDDLSLDLHYAAAVGGRYAGSGWGSLAGEPSLGEVGAALSVGLGDFLGVTTEVGVGVGVPVWPGAGDHDPGVFARLVLRGVAANTLGRAVRRR